MRLATVQGIEFTINADTSNAIDSIKKLSSALAKLQKIGTGDTGLKRVADEIKAFVEDLGKLEKIKDLDALSSAFKGLSSFGNAMSRLSQKPEAINSFADSMERLSGMDFSNLSEAASAIREIVSATGGASRNLSETASSASRSSSHIGGLSKALGVLKSGAGRAVSVIKAITHGLGSLAGAAGKVARLSISKIFSGIKWSASGALGPLRAIGGAVSNLASRFKRLLIMRTFRALIRGVVNAFKTGINNLYAWSNALGGEFASSMDRCASATLYLKNSLGAMVAPLVNALAPALDFVIDKVVTFLNAINQLIAKLTGASYWTQATHQATSYGGAVEDAMNGAGSAAKEAMKYLAPFDELNVLPSDSGHGGGGGGGSGGGGAGGGGLFQEMMEFDSNVSDFAEKLKESWENADFTEVGTIVGEKLKDALDNIPWDSIETTCNNIAQSIATFINGFVSTDELWASVGSAIGNGINTAASAWNTFFDTTNFSGIGSAIATALNNAIGTIDGNKLGRALSQKIKAFINLAYGFLVGTDDQPGFDFSKFGKWLGDSINGFLSNIEFDKMGTALGTALSGVITTGTTALSNINFTDLGTKIKTGITNALSEIEKAIKNVKWSDIGANLVGFVNGLFSNDGSVTLGSTLSTVVNGAISAVDGAIDNAEWGTWASELSTNINDLFNIDLGKAGSTTGEFISKFSSFVTSVIDDVEWDNLAKGLGSYINGLFASLTENDVAAGVGSAVEAITNALTKALQNVDWLLVFASLLDFIANLFAGLWNGTFGQIPGFPDISPPDLSQDYWDNYSNYNPQNPNNPGGSTVGDGGFGRPLEVEVTGVMTAIRDSMDEIDKIVDGGSLSVDEIKDGIPKKDKKIEDATVSASTFKDNVPQDEKSITATISGKTTPEFDTAKKQFDGIKDNTATKSITGKQENIFTRISGAFKEIKSNTATKTITGDKKASFKDAQVAFSGVKSNSATKTLYGAAPASGKFTEAYNAFRSITSNYATKTLYGSAPSSGGFTTAYNAFHSIKSDYATKTLYGSAPASGGFTTAYNAYHSLQDKTVTVTINGRANGVAAGGGYYQWTKAINDGAFATASGTVNEDMLYRAFSRALVDNNVGGDIILDGAVLYKKMVARNTQNTRATGVNAMAAT